MITTSGEDKLNVLIVDDYSQNRYLLEVLMRAHGWQVVSAEDGVAALEKAKTGDFDLIVSDVLMPRMDGFQLCREIMKHEKLRGIPFVLYSASVSDRDEAFALSLGAIRFIPKPIEPDRFIKLIEEVVHARPERPRPESGVPEEIYLKAYNEKLIHRMESYMVQLEAADQALFHEKEYLSVTLQSIGDAVITADIHGMVQYLNPVAEVLTGWNNADAQGLPVLQVFNIINETTRTIVENPVARCLREGRVVGLANHTILLHRDGKEFAIDDSAAPIRDRSGNAIGAILVFHDTTDKRGLARQISWQATHDSLTGLMNRHEFDHQLGQLLGSARHDGRHHVLCYLDLDQFKIVNDTAGHVAGDALLQQLSGLMQSRIRETDILARLGGDEFGLLLENCSLEKAQSIADGLLGAINAFKFVWQDRSFVIGASFGLVPVTADSLSPTDLLSAADSACYVAKDKGRNCVHIYQQDDAKMVKRLDEMAWVTRLQRAIEKTSSGCTPS